MTLGIAELDAGHLAPAPRFVGSDRRLDDHEALAERRALGGGTLLMLATLSATAFSHVL